MSRDYSPHEWLYLSGVNAFQRQIASTTTMVRCDGGTCTNGGKSNRKYSLDEMDGDTRNAYNE